MQCIVFTFEKLYCTERLDPSNKKTQQIFANLFEVVNVIIWDKELNYTFE